MHCLWRWAAAKAPADVDRSQPVVLRSVRGLWCAELAELEVGAEHECVRDPVCSPRTRSSEG